jgi:hypothetical protein
MIKKNIFLLLGFCVVSFNFIHGQINQGAFLVGGATYFNYNFPKGGSANSEFNISPNVGMFIVQDMAIGASVSYSAFNTGSSLSIAPYMRAYFKDYFFGQLQVGYGRTIMDLAGVATKTSGLIGEFQMGYTIFLTKQIAIDPALYYNFYMNGKKYYGSNVGMKLGFQIFLNHN